MEKNFDRLLGLLGKNKMHGPRLYPVAQPLQFLTEDEIEVIDCICGGLKKLELIFSSLKSQIIALGHKPGGIPGQLHPKEGLIPIAKVLSTEKDRVKRAYIRMTFHVFDLQHKAQAIEVLHNKTQGPVEYLRLRKVLQTFGKCLFFALQVLLEGVQMDLELVHAHIAKTN